MIALFSWKRPAPLTLDECWLATGAVHYARRSGMDTILATDDAGREMLCDRLALPFDEVLPLAPIPDELVHVRDLTKLMAFRDVLMGGKPVVHVDFDAFLMKPLPTDLLAASFFCEYHYPTKGFVRRINSDMPQPRFSEVPANCAASGVFGGCDVTGMMAVTQESIASALHPDNREVFVNANGYQASIVIGEAAFGAAFPSSPVMLAHGNRLIGEYQALGYVHLAGNKANADKMAKAAALVRRDFPEAFVRAFNTWISVPS